MTEQQQDKPQPHQIPEKRRAAIVKAAARWWDNTARHLVNKRFDLEETGRKVKTGSGNAPGIVVQGNIVPTIPSPLLLGQEWDRLTPRERGQVLKVYMHNFTEYKFPDLDERQNALAIPPSAIN